ncbi:MAG: AAA family ATPase [Nocardioidaceae bacterium]|nr:AAA family ATPase [Nocardioidaceae bacterium]
MRVAFVGKGGAGKSSIAGTFARLLARRGERVLAIDSDPMPGLAFSLGVDRSDAGIPDVAIEECVIDGRNTFRLRSGLSAEEAVLRYADVGPDGVLLLQLGKARGVRGENAGSHQAFQHVVEGVPDHGWSIVGDLPAGTRQPFFGWGRFARTVVVVVEPTPASLLSGRRLARLAGMPSAPRLVAVASKTRGLGDAELVRDGTGLPVIGTVPFDTSVSDGDREGAALLDQTPKAPAVAAIDELVSTLINEEEQP